MKILLLIPLLLTMLNSESPIPPPELLSECISDYFYFWGFDDSRMCYVDEDMQTGDYHLFACWIKKHSDYHGEYKTVTFVSKCVYDEIVPVQSSAYLLFAPLITYCEPDPLTGQRARYYFAYRQRKS